MKTLSLTILGLCAGSLLLAKTTVLDPATFSNYVRLGRSPESSAVKLSTTGGTLVYKANVDKANDGGIQTTLARPVVFEEVGDTLVYSYQIKDIVNKVTSANAFRTGFGFGKKACIHMVTGVGETGNDVRFAKNDSGNPFSGGEIIDKAQQTLKKTPSLRFDDGNTVNVTLTLKLLAVGAATYDYELTADFSDVSGTVKATASQVIPGVASNQVTSIYHLTNSASLEVEGDTWTIQALSPAK